MELRSELHTMRQHKEELQNKFKDLQVEFQNAQQQQQQQQQQQHDKGKDKDLAEAHEELTKRHNRIVELNQQ